jgi:multicomponent Na+:H+ antiporter subunit C
VAHVSEVEIYALAAVGLFTIALHAFITRAHLIRKILALNIMCSAVFLLLVAIARRNGADVPDPVPHAMVLTGIVIAVASTAVALSIVRIIHARLGVERLGDLRSHDR